MFLPKMTRQMRDDAGHFVKVICKVNCFTIVQLGFVIADINGM